MITWPLPEYGGGSAKGCQTSQYSLCISVTQFSFHMVNSTFYTVNFLLFIWSTWVLCGPLFTFNNINFYFSHGQLNFLFFVWSSWLFIWSSRLLIWSTFCFWYQSEKNTDCRLAVKCRLSVKCRLKTAGQTRGKMQTQF